MNDLDKYIGNSKKLQIKENPSEQLDGFLDGSNTSTVSPLKISEFKPYIEDVRTDEGYVKLAKQRAINQPWSEQVLRTGANLIPNIALGLAENAGYMAELVIDKEGDYSNSLTEWAKEKRDPFGETYRVNPEETWDMSDSAWWLQNFGGLAESIGEFLVTGVGVGSALGKTASGISKALKAKGLLAQGLQGAAQVGTSTTLGYLESAMIGSDLYKKIIAEGGTPEEAAAGAAEAVKLNTSLLTLTNLTGISPLFKSSRQLSKAQQLGLGRKAGESLRDRISRIKSYVDELKISEPKKAAFLGREAGMEALEEELNLFSERRGEIAGGIRKDENLLSSFTEAVFTPEGLLSGILGAVGGVVQSGAINYAPRPTRDEQGQLKFKPSLDRERREQEFADKRDYATNLANNLNSLLDLNSQLRQAASEGNIEKQLELKDRIFNSFARINLEKDTLEGIQQSLEEISKTPNEDLNTPIEKELTQITQNLEEKRVQLEQAQDQQQIDQISQEVEQLATKKSELEKQKDYNKEHGRSLAIQAGLTESLEDNTYKEIASDRIGQISDYVQKYEQFKREYETTPEAEQVELGKEVARRYLNVSNLERISNRYTSRYAEAESGYLSNTDKVPNSKVPVQAKLDAVNELVNETEVTTEKYRRLQRDRKNLEDELKTLNETEKRKIPKKDKSILTELKEKYKQAKDIELDYFIDSAEYDQIRSEKGKEKFIRDEIKRRKDLIEEQREVFRKQQAERKKKADKLQKLYEKSKEKINENLTEERDKLDINFIEEELYKPDTDLDQAENIINSLLQRALEAEEQKKASKKRDTPIESVQSVEETPIVQPEEGKEILLVEEIEDFYEFPEEFTKSEAQLTGPDISEKDIVKSQDDEEIKDESEIRIWKAAKSLAIPSPKLYKPTKDGLITISNEILDEYPRIMMSGDLNIGDNLTLIEDKNFKGELYGKEETYESLIEKEQKEGQTFMYRPIAVYKGDIFLHYLHELRYIRPERVQPEITIGDTTIDNIKEQKRILYEIRKRVVENGGTIQAVISDFTGEISYSRNVNEEGESIFVDSSEAFQNPDIKIGVIKNGAVSIGNTEYQTDNSEDFYTNMQGRVVALLPRANRDIPRASILKVKKTQFADTLFTILDSFINDSNKEIQDQFATKGFNLKDRDSVSQLISKYTFLTFDLASNEKALEIADDPKTGKYYMDIQNGRIFIQASSRARKEINSNNWNDMQDVLKNHLSNMYTSIDQENFGSDFTYYRIEDGEVKDFTEDYLDFVKSNTQTNILENRFIYNGDQKYSYFDNPNINFEIDQEVKEEPKPSKEPIDKGLNEGAIPNNLMDDFDSTTEEPTDYSPEIERQPIIPDNQLELVPYGERPELYKAFGLVNDKGNRHLVNYSNNKQINAAINRIAELNSRTKLYRFKLSNSTKTNKKIIDIYSIKSPEIQLSLFDKAQNISNSESETRRKQCL